nr:immunoglobulin light chain junction region [Macaca mulatta]
DYYCHVWYSTSVHWVF